MSPSASSAAGAEAFPEPEGTAASARDFSWQIAPATRSDHTAIFQFLTAVFQGPSWDEFRASLEAPWYEPGRRLLGVSGSQIVAHAQQLPRTMWFGLAAVPVAALSWLGVLPQFRGRGIGRRLLAASEQAMARRGALVGLAWTRDPRFFCRDGWALWGPRYLSQAGTREILAALAARGLYPRPARRLSIRPWRRVELAALVRIYDQNFAAAYGPLRRGEACWQWLVERRGYDQLYVAIHGRDRAEGEEFEVPIVGYAAIRGQRIVELLTDAGHPGAAVDLLVRACGDAIEGDRYTIGLHAPPGHRLHRLFRAATDGQTGLEPDGNEVLMAKVLHPLRLIRTLGGELHARARAAGLSTPASLGLKVDKRTYRLELTDEGLQARTRSLGTDYLSLGAADFCRLLLGYLDWEAALCARRVSASTPSALAVARILFPRLVLWHPLLDDLPAQV